MGLGLCNIVNSIRPWRFIHFAIFGYCIDFKLLILPYLAVDKCLESELLCTDSLQNLHITLVVMMSVLLFLFVCFVYEFIFINEIIY